MLLSKYLEKIDDNTRLYIGSKTSFFFIGKKDRIKELFPRIEDYYYYAFQRALHNAKISKDQLEIEIKETEEQIRILKSNLDIEFDEKAKRKGEAELNELKELLKQKKESYDNRISVISHYTKAVANFKPFLERVVVDTHRKVVMHDEQGIAIKIRGYESGKYWTYTEWLKDYER